jgi:dipeptidyl aminopeptidase/acylaminoacyl peptidase
VPVFHYAKTIFVAILPHSLIFTIQELFCMKPTRATTFALRIMIVLLTTQVFAQPKQPITHESMWLMKRVGSPQVSPDGKWVVFGLTEPAYDDKDQTNDVWIVPADGSTKPRRLTATKGGESSIAWSPDSKTLAFAAKREGDEMSQIYLLNVLEGGGEAQRFTTLSTGAFSPKWRRDGKALLFQSAVLPNLADDDAQKKAATERKARKYKARVYETFPIRQWDHWLDDTETHLFVQTLDASKAKDLFAGTAFVKQTGFGGVGGNSGYDLQPTWSPDGQSIVFTATTDRTKAAFADVNYHLWSIPANGGEAKRLTTGKDSYSYGDPKFSSTGKLYCQANANNDKVYNLTRLAEIDTKTGVATMLTTSFDRSVENFEPSPDGKTLYLTAEDMGLLRFYAVNSAGGEVRPFLEQNAGCYNGFSVGGSQNGSPLVIVAQYETAVSPNEIVRIDGKRQQVLTQFNAATTATIDWQPLRSFTFTSKGGKQIQSFVALPPNFDGSKKYPLFVLMHGGPHTMYRDAVSLRWNYHLLAAEGYIVLLTNYTGSTGFGAAFAQGIQFDPFVTPANEINEAADEALRRFPFVDSTRQACGGASYGGHLANWMQGTTTRYKCLIAHAGLINLESQWGTSDGIYHREVNNGGPVWEQGKVWREQNPIRRAASFKTPILLTVGENDFRVPINQTLENWSVLQRLQIPSKLIVFPDASHWILKGEDSRYFYGEVRAWLKKYLGS